MFYLFTFVHILNAQSLSVMLIALYLFLTEHSVHPGFALNCNLPSLSFNQHDIPARCSSSGVRLKGQCDTAVVLNVTFSFLSVCLNDLYFLHNIPVIYNSHGISPHHILYLYAEFISAPTGNILLNYP